MLQRLSRAQRCPDEPEDEKYRSMDRENLRASEDASIGREPNRMWEKSDSAIHIVKQRCKK